MNERQGAKPPALAKNMKKSRISGKSGPAAGKGAGPGGDAPDDLAVWQYVTRNIRPLQKKTAAARHKKPVAETKTAPVAKQTAARQPATKISIGSLAATRTPAPAAKTSPVKPSPVRPSTLGFDRSTETKLRKGRLEIEGRIDLHGMTQGEAHAALGRFIRAAVQAERRTLLVITGKGRLGGGVLRRSLPLWLEDSAYGRDVLAITPAAPKDGGDGAFYIRLRKPKA